MKNRSLCLCAALWVAPAVVGQSQGQRNQKPLPNFEDFSTSEVFNGSPAVPVLVTDKDREFRTRIREGAQKGPNFAGHYTIVKWGLGSGVISFAVVDAISGRVYHNPFGPVGFPYKGTTTGRGYKGLEYRLTSSLLVIDGCPDHVNPDLEAGLDSCGTHYYKWERKRFVHLRSVAVPEARK